MKDLLEAHGYKIVCSFSFYRGDYELQPTIVQFSSGQYFSIDKSDYISLFTNYVNNAVSQDNLSQDFYIDSFVNPFLESKVAEEDPRQ